MRRSSIKARYKVSCAVAAILTGCAGASLAADASPSDAVTTATAGTAVEEIVVTAQRRDESVQKVPLTVQAFTGVTLQKLNVNALEDLLRYTPNVSYANNGPGQGNIFMRGLSAGFAGNQSSATIGNFPNVAIYLDDQSMQFPARNVDIYVADMDRVEVLEGPQGTLFGGGAEAGAVRYITNKPKLDAFSAHAEGSYGFTVHGDDNQSGNIMLNVPVIKDKLAVRVVVYDDHHGGYIDNVPSTLTRSNQDLGNYYLNIKQTAAGCPNGQPVNALGTGYCTQPNAPQANNAGIAHRAQNPITYTGVRASALWQVNDDWDVLVSQSFANLDAEGISSEYPVGSDFQPLAPLQITSFAPSYDKDKYENTSWTVNGKIDNFKVIYTGSYMIRNISQQMDYTNYARSYFGPYYQCTGGNTGFGKGAAQCYSPVGYWQDTVRNTHMSHEVRVSSPDTWRARFIVGGFYEQFKIYDNMNFNYKTFPACSTANLNAALAGGAPCVGDIEPAVGTTANDPSVRSDQTAFGEDTQRGYDQTAFFGSVDFDVIPNVLTISGGTRYFRYSEYELGSVYSTVDGCLNVAVCTAGQTNIDSHNDHVSYSGFKSRANVTWHVNPDTIAYFTFSQGFRPGGFNRLQKKVIADASGAKQYLEPNSYAPDSLTNYEIGVKTQLFDRRLQLNVSAYYMDWDNVQFLIYNPTEGINTTFGLNGPSYNVEGVEGQFVGRVTHGLTIQGSASYNHDTQSSSPCLVDNISGTAAFGQCISVVKPSGGVAQSFSNPFGTLGSVPAFSPDFQGNIRARYEWEMGEYKFNAMIGANYVGGMYNEPGTYPSGTGVLIPNTTYLRFYQPGYATVDLSVGVSKDKWSAEIVANNVGNSHASMFTSSAQFIKSEVPLRPTVVSLKISADF